MKGKLFINLLCPPLRSAGKPTMRLSLQVTLYLFLNLKYVSWYLFLFIRHWSEYSLVWLIYYINKVIIRAARCKRIIITVSICVI